MLQNAMYKCQNSKTSTKLRISQIIKNQQMHYHELRVLPDDDR
jgi:hypothetical protein